MSADEFLLDAATRHAVFLQRFGSGQSRIADGIVKDYGVAVNARLDRQPELLAEANITELMAGINSDSGTFAEDYQTNMVELTEKLSENEAEFSHGMLSAAVVGAGVILPATETVNRYVANKEMTPNATAATFTIGEATAQYTSKKKSNMINVVNDAILADETVTQAKARVDDLVRHRMSAQSETLVRTNINFISSAAREAVMVENKAVLAGYRWDSVLDSNTTLICSGRDGNIYPIGSGPLPPAHWGCRSTISPEVKPEFKADIKSKGSSRPSNKDYGDWLKTQPVSFQEEYFSKLPDGEAKMALFRKGGLEIQNFRNELGVEYTLEQLRALNPLAFQRAGIDLE